MAGTGKHLKSSNGPAIWGILIADAVVLFFIEDGTASLATFNAQVIGVRVAAALVAPAAALLFGSVLPASVKDMLVFWRVRDVLPGHRAQQLGHRDPRIDMDRLSKNISVAFPEGPREQNAFWYRLFKKVEGEPNVEHCNRTFLLLRELAAISFVAMIVAALAWAFVAGASRLASGACALFAVQYLLAALGAAAHGRRLVTTVLAAHSAKRRP